MNQDFMVYSAWLRKITRLVKAEQGNACALPINLVAGVYANGCHCIEALLTRQ